LFLYTFHDESLMTSWFKFVDEPYLFFLNW
jgi:hypothetical protein